MNWQEAAAEIKRRGAEWLKRDGSGKGYVCPICGSGNGRNGTGLTTKDGEHFSCFGRGHCFTNASILDIIAIQKGVDTKNFPAVLRAACEEFSIDFDGLTNDTNTGGKDYEERRAAQAKAAKEKQERAAAARAAFVEKELPKIKEKALRDTRGALAYIKGRGISEETARWHEGEIGFLKPFPVKGNYRWTAGAVIFFHDGSFEARNVDSAAEKGKRHFRPAGQPARMWNFSAIDKAAAMDGDADARPVFVVEGIMDALSVEEAGGVAVALNSTANAAMFAEELARRDVDKLPPVILSLDDDESGQAATEKLADALMNKGIFFLRTNICDVGGDEGQAKPKDANEALQRNRGQFIANVKQAAQKAVAAFDEWRNKDREEYEKGRAGARLLGFMKGVRKRARVWMTGFREFDRMTYGGLTEGLYLLGGETAAGKTAFAMQLAGQVAAAGGDVLYISLELSERELFARSLSREMFTVCHEMDSCNGHDNALSAAAIMRGGIDEETFQGELLEVASIRFMEYGDKIRFVTGLGDIGVSDINELTQQYKKIMGVSPVVFVDYFQLLRATDKRMGAKEKADENAFALKRLSRDCEVPVIALSSFNRGAYGKKAGLEAFKESGMLEYSADMVIALKHKYKSTEEDELEQERMELEKVARQGGKKEIALCVLKGRNCGKFELTLDYYPRHNIFFEQKVADRYR